MNRYGKTQELNAYQTLIAVKKTSNKEPAFKNMHIERNQSHIPISDKASERIFVVTKFR